jgi:hypothetical protein
MADKITTPVPATKPGADADQNPSNAVPGDNAMSGEELDKVTGGINPQPLPPRTGGDPPTVID